jgi:hypothetical protein
VKYELVCPKAEWSDISVSVGILQRNSHLVLVVIMRVKRDPTAKFLLWAGGEERSYCLMDSPSHFLSSLTLSPG